MKLSFYLVFCHQYEKVTNIMTFAKNEILDPMQNINNILDISNTWAILLPLEYRMWRRKYAYPLFWITTLVVIGTDCIGTFVHSCKSNCHTITITPVSECDS